MVVDLLGEDLRASYWKEQCGSTVATVRFGEHSLVLAKPQTFMNLSGRSVRRLVSEHGVEIGDVVVVHDDIDLAPGRVLVKRGGGHGGHNGLRSVHDSLQSDAYIRVRVGVGRPPGRMDAADYVLEPLKGAAWDDLEASIPSAAQAVITVLERGPEAAMREFNTE